MGIAHLKDEVHNAKIRSYKLACYKLLAFYDRQKSSDCLNHT